MKTQVNLLSRRVPYALAGAVLALVVARSLAQPKPQPLPPGVVRMPVAFSGGYETEGVDRGRPVILIAAALGVPPAVFREAFSQVHPAGPNSGGPTDAEARANKAALMKVLAPYGVTNERLDTVSNFYRYPPGRGHLWQHRAATANAMVKGGKIIGTEITDGGAGYSSLPIASVPGLDGIAPQVELTFGKELETNGAVTSLPVAPTKAAPAR